jgi:hypothetical protein
MKLFSAIKQKGRDLLLLTNKLNFLNIFSLLLLKDNQTIIFTLVFLIGSLPVMGQVFSKNRGLFVGQV